MKKKLIIGIAGEISAGKTTVSDYLKEKHGAVTFRFSDMLRDILDRLYLPKDRTHFQTLSTALRQNFSEDIMSKVLTEDVKTSEHKLIITEGIRRPTDVTYLKNLEGFVMIALNVEQKTRYNRLLTRGEKADDATKTWEEFEKEDTAESEQKIREIKEDATYKIDNNGTLEELYAKIDTIISEHYES